MIHPLIPRLKKTEGHREEGKGMGARSGVSDVLSCLSVRPSLRLPRREDVGGRRARARDVTSRTACY